MCVFFLDYVARSRAVVVVLLEKHEGKKRRENVDWVPPSYGARHRRRKEKEIVAKELEGILKRRKYGWRETESSLHAALDAFKAPWLADPRCAALLDKLTNLES